MTLQDLMKMTIKKLRDEAHKFDVKDALGMSKEQLVELLCEKMGIEHKAEIAKGIGRRAMKAKIGELKKQRAKLIAEGAEGNAKAVYVNRRRIRAVRRRLRKVILRAKLSAARAAKKKPAPETAAS